MAERGVGRWSESLCQLHHWSPQD